MLDRFAITVATAFSIGWALVIVAGWLGEASPVAGLLFLAGGALVLLSLPLLPLGAGVMLIRWLGRATGFLATPVERAAPQPGWEGWLVALDSGEHELWIPGEGPGRRVLLDGTWVRTGSWGRGRTTFEVAGHRAELVGSVDSATMIKAVPLVLAAGLLDGAAGEPPPMRYELLVDGTRRPSTERRLFRDGGAMATRLTRPSAAPVRHINLDPPS